jgi:hypothetical protein
MDKEELEFNIKERNSMVNPTIFNGFGLQRLQSNKSHFYYNCLYHLGLKDIENAKICLLKSAYIDLMFIDINYAHKYTNLKKYQEFRVMHLNGEPFSTILLSGNDAFIKRFFEHLELTELDHKTGLGTILIMLKKGLIVKDKATINTYTNLLRKKKITNERGFGKGDLMFMLGIIDNDISLINEGIDVLIKTFKREDINIAVLKNNALLATAMVKFAHRFGFEPDTSSPYLCKDLLDYTNLDFVPDEELLSYERQLEEINTPGYVYDSKKDIPSEWSRKIQEETEKEDKKKGFLGRLFGK